MKRFLLGFVLAISIPAFAAVIWPSGVYLETFQNGFKFGTGKILSVLNDVITFDGKRLDDADKDIFFQEDFEGAAVSFTCDANITAADDTGLMGSDTSKSFTQSTGAQDEVCSSANIPFAGAQEAKLCLVSSGSTNFDLKVYDVTNSTYLGTAPLRGNSNQDCVWFEGESSTANIRYDLVARIEENADELIIDNVQAKYFPFETGDIYASSEEESYVPAYTGVGTVSNSDCYAQRNGSDLDLRCRFTVGTPTATEMRISLPDNLISSSDIDTLQYLGQLERNAQADDVYGVAVQPSSSYLVFTRRTSSVTGLTPVNGSDIFAAGNVGSFDVSVPIAGWTNTKKSVTVKNTTSSDIASENVFSVKVSSAGVASDPNIEGWYDSVSKTATGLYSIDVTGMSLSSPMNCQSQVNSPSSFGNVADCDIDKLATTSTEIVIRCHNDGGTGAATDEDFTLNCQKAEPDFVKERDRVYTFAADSLTGNYVRAEGGSGSITASSTDIPFTEAQDTANAWDGDEYTVQKNGSKIKIVASARFTTNTSRRMMLYKNGSQYKYISQVTISGDDYVSGRYFSTAGEFAEGDTLSIRDDSGGTINNDTTKHYLNISEEYGDRGTFVGQWGYESCHVKDVKSSGTDGGGSSATPAKRDLNTIKGDCSFLSLSSSEFTLKKGSYLIEWCAPAYDADRHQSALYNISDSVYVEMGQSKNANSTGNVENDSCGYSRISIAEDKTFAIYHEVQSAAGGNGWGVSTGGILSITTNEVYTQVKITKVR